MRSKLVTSLLATLCQIPLWSAETGKVSVVITDTFGKLIRSVELRIVDPNGKIVTTLRGNATIELPYSEYTFVATASLHQPERRQVTINSKAALVWLALPFVTSSHSDKLFPAARIFVRGLPESDAPVLRLMSVIGSYEAYGRISRGSVELDNVPPGLYLVLVLLNGSLHSIHRIEHSLDRQESTIDLQVRPDP